MSNLNDNTQTDKKPSKLEEFKLFYEAVDSPDFISSANKTESSPKRSSYKSNRISRRKN